MATLPGLSVGLTLNSGTFVAETRRIDASVNRMGRNVAQQNTVMQRGFDGVSGAVRGVVASLGTMLTVAGAVRLASLGKDALDAAGNLGELAAQAGVTTRDLQGLQLAGVQVGVSSEQMVTALAQFGVRAGEASRGVGELADTLERYGIATRDSSGQVRSSISMLGDLANAVQRAGSETEQLTIVADAFGARVGPKLLPLLADGAEGLLKWATAAEKAGLVLGDEFIAAADRASDGLATLQFAISKGFEIGVVKAFAGEVQITAEHIERAREAGEAFGRVVGNAVQFAIDSFASLQPFLETTRQEFNAIKNVLIDFGILAPDSIEGVEAKLEDLIAKRRELSEAAEAHGIAPAETFAVQLVNQEIEGLNKIRDAMLQQADAAAAASAATKPLYVDIRKQAQATDVATASTVKLAEAQRDLLTQFRSDTEADLRLRQLASQQRMTAELAGAQLEGAQVFDATRTAIERHVAEVARLNELLAAGAINQDTFSRAVAQSQEALRGTSEELQKVSFEYDLMLDTSRQFAQNAAGGLTDAAFAGQGLVQTLNDIGLSLAKSITEALVFRAIMLSLGLGNSGQPTGGGLFGLFAGAGAAAAGGSFGAGNTTGAGGAGFSSLQFGGPRAAGGPVSPGSVYEVGERGREWFVPNVAGQIVPAGGGGSQAAPPQINIIDQRGKGAPPIETNVDVRGVMTAVIRAEVSSMGRDGSLGMMTGARRKGIARG